MNNKEIAVMGMFMVWSRFESRSGQYYEWTLDTKTPAPDGIYPVVVNNYSTTRMNGIEVRNGHFCLPTTMKTVERAVRQNLCENTNTFHYADDFDFVYIEDLVFDERTKTFFVKLGT